MKYFIILYLYPLLKSDQGGLIDWKAICENKNYWTL